MILYELDGLHRQIFVDGRAFPTTFEFPAYLGYSIGRWEGDTFIVETRGFNERTPIDAMGHRRALLVQPEVSPRPVVILEIASQSPLQVPRVQDHDMVQTVSSDRADQTFGVWILPGAAGRREDFLNLERSETQPNLAAINAVPIPQQIARSVVLCKSLDNLLGRPGRRGVVR
jgi:hypothetical protein